MSTRPSTEQQREAIALLYNRARVESVADPEWFLFDSLYMTGRLTSIDPRTVEQAFAQWAGVALLFSYSGLSFAVSRRVSAVARSLLREDRSNDLLTYHLMNFMRSYFEGLWDVPSGVDDALIERALRTGQLWDVDTFLGMDAGMQIDKGNFPAAASRIEKISSLIDDYGYRFAESNRLALTTFLALARGRLDEALEAVERYAERPEEMLNLLALGTKAKIHLLRDELDAAGATLERAEALLDRMGRAAPFHSGAYHTSRLLHDVLLLRDGLARGDTRSIRATRRRFRRDVRPALHTAARMAPIRTEAYRSIGSFHWLLGNVRRAARWWQRSLAEGARLGARPELARTHLEVAERLTMSSVRPIEVAGLDVHEHLGRAETLFTELGLARDLERVHELRVAQEAA